MAFSTTAFSEFVDNVERTVLQRLQDRKNDPVRMLFTPVPFKENGPDRVTFDSVALSGFAGRVTENASFPTVTPKKMTSLTKILNKYGDKLEITDEMMTFSNKGQNAKFGAEDLANRINNGIDLELCIQAFIEADQTTASVLANNGTQTASIATADAAAVASASHSAGGVSFSNLLSGGPALSLTSLNAAIEHGQQNTPDDYGTYLAPNFDTILVHNNPYMIQMCHKLFASTLTPEAATNAANYYGGAGQFKVIAINYGNRLTSGAVDSNKSNVYRWAILDSAMCRRSWFMQMKEPEIATKFVDDDDIRAKVLVKAYEAHAIVRPQGTVYSLATQAPTVG